MNQQVPTLEPPPDRSLLLSLDKHREAEGVNKHSYLPEYERTHETMTAACVL